MSSCERDQRFWASRTRNCEEQQAEENKISYLLKPRCFLSDEMQSISNNTEGILQCALDFRSCFVEGVGDVTSANESLVNISQTLLIKQTFDKNIKELHLSHLKSSEHGEFGLCSFLELPQLQRRLLQCLAMTFAVSLEGAIGLYLGFGIITLTTS